MNFIKFPAQLCSDYSDGCEYGRVEIFPNAGALDFTADFVPLLPLGSGARAEWMLGTKVLAKLPGEVYLSSPGLVRLVNIPQKAMAPLVPVFAANTSIPAFIRRNTADSPGKRIPAEIVYLSRHRLTLMLTGAVPTEKRLFLSAEVDFLTLSSLEIEIESQVLLNREGSLLHCKILPGSDENLIAHSAYLSRLEQLD